MDKIKAFLSDKKNTPIVAAVAGIVLVLVVLFYLKQFGIIGGGGGNEFADTAATDSATTQSTPAPTGADVPPGPTSPTGTGTDAATAPTPAAAANAAKIPPMFAYRKDPFMGFSGVPTTKDLMMTMLPNVRRVRLAPAGVSVGGPTGSGPVEEAMPPQPMRRVAGIMWGSTVKAIIESGGKTYIVVPGQQIPDERVRVESIEPSGVILSTLDTKRPMFIRVNLAGSPAAQAQADAGANMGNEAPPDTSFNRGGGRSRGGGAPTEAPPPGF